MADPVSLSSGLLTLATFAFQSSIVLYKAIESYRSHPKNVRDLKEELETLADVLKSLAETIEKHKDTDLTTLKLPLLRCGKACREFEDVVAKCSSRSGGPRTSFRDWAKLRYMGDGIDEFRRMLAGYKSTITIALANANLYVVRAAPSPTFATVPDADDEVYASPLSSRQSSISTESLERYKSMIRDTTADLQDHLDNVNEKLQSEFLRAAERSSGDAALVRQMEEERSSAQQCIAICSQLYAQINQIQPTLAADRSQRSADARAITADGLEGCKDALGVASQRLEEHLKVVVDRLMVTAKKAMSSPEEAAKLEVLHAEWQTARLCIDVCSKANESVTKVNVNVFENIKGEEEILQFFASTTGRTVHAKDIFVGSKGVQFGGQISDVTIQQISRDFSPSARMVPGSNPQIVAPVADGNKTFQFLDRYGKGHRLSPQPATHVQGPLHQGSDSEKASD